MIGMAGMQEVGLQCTVSNLLTNPLPSPCIHRSTTPIFTNNPLPTLSIRLNRRNPVLINFSIVIPPTLLYNPIELGFNSVSMLDHSVENANTWVLRLDGVCQVDESVAVFYRSIAVFVCLGRGFD